MLHEAAIGDAYGAGYEYVDDEFYKAHPNDLSGYVAHPRHKIGEGRYTDDTEMSTAVAEAMILGPAGSLGRRRLDQREWIRFMPLYKPSWPTTA